MLSFLSATVRDTSDRLSVTLLQGFAGASTSMELNYQILAQEESPIAVCSLANVPSSRLFVKLTTSFLYSAEKLTEKSKDAGKKIVSEKVNIDDEDEEDEDNESDLEGSADQPLDF